MDGDGKFKMEFGSFFLIALIFCKIMIKSWSLSGSSTRSFGLLVSIVPNSGLIEVNESFVNGFYEIKAGIA